MIITFREGCSGNWLATLLAMGKSDVIASFRQDIDGSKVPDDVFHFNGNHDSQTLDSAGSYEGQPIITCHSTNYELLQQVYPNRHIIRIAPRTKILQSIAAAFYKLGPGDTTTVNLAFEYIKDYYDIHTVRDPLPHVTNSSIIDFGEMTELPTFAKICKQHFGIELGEKRIKFFNDYWKLQKKVLDESQLKPNITKQQLLESVVDDGGVFNRAAYIFLYEKLNNIPEERRTWTIDDVPDTLEELANLMSYY